LEKLSFTIDNAELVNENVDSKFSLLSLDFFASGRNLHDTFVSEETLMRTAETIKNCPIVWMYDPILNDAYTHSPEEVPCGFIPESAEIKYRKLEDSRTIVSVTSYVWKKFSGKILDFFRRDNSEKPVSVEMSVYETQEKSDGLLELLDYRFEAVTILGSFVKPAIPLARATVLQFAKEYKNDYSLEFSDKYENIDFTIPQNVKSAAKKSLDTYKESASKATSVSLAMARFLVKNDKITPEKIRQMAKFFGRKVEYDDITIGFFGGKDGAKWSKSLFDSIDEIDSKRISYFDIGGENMPYKRLDEINKSLAGIDPPISLSQANEIAKQADSIGTDEEKNGWAIAISSFKKGHIVKDGKWVKKEKMAEETDVAFEKEGNDKSGDNPKNKEEKEISMADEKKIEEEKKETPAEEKVESPEEEKKEKEEGVEMAAEPETPDEKKKENGEEEKFSLNAYVDLAATLAYLQAETEDNEEMAGKLKMAVEEISKGEFASPPVVMSGMFAAMNRMNAKMCKMAEKMAELEKFKADVEGQQKMMAVENTLAEMAEKVVIPEEVMSEMRASADKFSFEQLDAWKNECKAKSFDFAAKDKKGESHLRIGLPIINKTPRPQNDTWAGVK